MDAWLGSKYVSVDYDCLGPLAISTPVYSQQAIISDQTWHWKHMTSLLNVFKGNKKDTWTTTIDVMLLSLLKTLSTSSCYCNVFFVDLHLPFISWVLLEMCLKLAKETQRSVLKRATSVFVVFWYRHLLIDNRRLNIR